MGSESIQGQKAACAVDAGGFSLEREALSGRSTQAQKLKKSCLGRSRYPEQTFPG